MPNAFQDMQPTKVGYTGNAMADPSLGAGLAQGALDLKRLYPLWQDQYINGQTQLQFTDWMKAQGMQNPVLPK